MGLTRPPPDTARLRFAELTPADAPFMRRLLNDPGFLRHVGDRQVRSDDDAVAYLERGPLAGYRAHGYGLWRLDLRAGGQPAGICGLVRRDTLPEPDLGYALLAEFAGLGLASEAAAATLAHALGPLALPRVLAITGEDHAASRRVLEKLGMALEGPRRVGEETLLVYAASRG